MRTIFASILLSYIAYNLFLVFDNEADIDVAEYCEMRSLWEQDKEHGVIEVQRKGWPPYGDDSVCEDYEEIVR